jgi:uncharacterized protein YqgC (DUF456 family)
VFGLIGALIAPAVRTRPKADDLALEEERKAGPLWSRFSAVGLFWLSLLVVTILGCLGTIAYFLEENYSQNSPFGDSNYSEALWDGLLAAGFGFILFLPVLQLIAAALVALLLATTPRTDKGKQFLQLGKIALGTLLGTISGAVLTVASFFLVLWLIAR